MIPLTSAIQEAIEEYRLQNVREPNWLYMSEDALRQLREEVDYLAFATPKTQTEKFLGLTILRVRPSGDVKNFFHVHVA